MSNENTGKAKESRFKKEIMQLLAERDESIRQTFTNLDNKVGNAFSSVEFRINVIMAAITELGIDETMLQDLAKKVTEKMQEVNAQQLQKEGGEKNEGENQNTVINEKDRGDTELQPEQLNESGDEHFG